MGDMRRPIWNVAALSACCVLASAVLPTGARANHLAPGVSVKLELVKKARECGRNTVGRRAPCGWRGAYDARLSWSASCGDPSASAELAVNANVVKRDGKLGRGYTSFNPDQLSGQETVRLTPGTRVRALAEVSCTLTATNGEVETAHAGRAGGSSGDVFIRPFLDGYEITRSTICGVRLPGRKLGTTLQARQYATVGWGLRYSAQSMLRPGSLSRQLKQVVLRASGAGARLRRSPARHLVREVGYAQFVRPRRRGRVSLWAVIGGVATNKVKVPVIRLPRGCA